MVTKRRVFLGLWLTGVVDRRNEIVDIITTKEVDYPLWERASTAVVWSFIGIAWPYKIGLVVASKITGRKIMAAG